MDGKKEQEANHSAFEASVARGAEEDLPAYSAHPTAESPFDFPAACSGSQSHAPQLRQLIAIPQIASTPTAPFLDAYAQPLLQYGITPESWRAFLTTISAFLAARVSNQALSHAADIGRQVGTVPKRLGQGTLDHARSIKTNIRDAARDGKYVSAAFGVVGGAISLPVGTALRAVGATVSLPGTAIRAVAQKPQTPRERAAAYAAAATLKWFGQRGLQAQLVDVTALASMVGLGEPGQLLQRVATAADGSASAQMATLSAFLSPLEIFSGSTLDLGVDNLWLIITQAEGVEDVSEKS
ncbi:hypothetical protein BO70DRAFT_359656 [Aspergillus heteromorphus CBS 117.55]|uniref:Uncharacterized protein n=1 Tax=Aspergillus heteromorphus CBS 117.55 TaxID=1448321 RepID=A0A317WR53_9EURO|nr:uncharacterized protein BO70DRAFT_359656 [Aspergillus heteromorphus CBS 117.55]PWY88181.1 hypothetical protein BO70DRAFT_359656 [Aspergillus heteromorphus CBS 117.55]